MHNFGGALVVVHSSQSDYAGTSFMRHFLYGANLRAMECYRMLLFVYPLEHKVTK
ncbi:hypothetical protein GCM10008027_29290 [Pseudoalteromonas gelatinilytica]|uniref:Uncharacterized protein n=1 Tax=Pseudoalteromonas gelatinilytica TaxID=1703256 RepID=A0ABQ1TT85_9GAMM|nr:hypothetical protein GCM10008027_29290 [Pseudoalteromonas profundi]